MRKLLLLTSPRSHFIVFGDAQLGRARHRAGQRQHRSSTRTRIRICAGDRSGRTAAAARRRRPACARSRTCSTWARPAAACGRPRTTASPGCRSPTARFRPDRSARSTSSDSNPNVVYVGTGSEAIRSNVIVGRGVYKSTDAGKTWQYVGPEGRRADRPAEGPSEEPRHRLRRRDRPAVRLGTGARRLPHERRRQDVAEGAVHQRSDRRRVDRDQLAESRTSCTRARGAGSASRGRSSAAARRRKAASTRRPTAAITGRASATGSPTI